MPDLPVDILFKIIEGSGGGRKPDFDVLWALYPTCRTLQVHAQKFLFRNIRLWLTSRESCYDRSPENMLKIFLDRLELIVEANPDAATCVKNLEFKTSYGEDLPDKLIVLLRKFKNLRELQCGRQYCRLSWTTSLSDMEKRKWEAIFHLPSIVDLRIVSFKSLPVSILFPHAWRALFLDENSSIGAPEGDLDKLPPLPMHIASLQADRGGFDSLGPLFTTDPTIGVPVVNEQLVRCLFLACITDADCSKLGKFPTLQSLALDISKIKTPSVLRDLHPEALQKLSWLGLTFYLDIFEAYYPVPVRVYPSEAITEVGPTGFPALRRIEITLVRKVLGLHNTFGPELRRLDNLLASSSLFPVLEQVNVNVKVANMELWDTDYAWLRSHLEDVMPLVTGRPGCTLISSLGRAKSFHPASWAS